MAPIPEEALRARQDYIDGKPVKAILAETKLSRGQLYHWLDGAPQADGTTLLPPIPRRRKIGRAVTRAALIRQLMQIIGMQVDSLQKRAASAGYQVNDGDARVTAVLARMMRELTAHDDTNRKPETHDIDNDPVPRDPDEFRRELARRIGALVDAERAREGEGTGKNSVRVS